MSPVELVVTAVVLPLVLAEAYAWCPQWADALLRWHARRLPSPISERLLEEWRGVAAEFPGGLSKLVFALDLLRAVPRVRHEALNPRTAYRPFAAAAFELRCRGEGALLLIFFAPLMIGVAILLWKTTGRVLLRGQVARNDRPFTIYFFSVDARSPVGHFVVRANLHTLPTLWNVTRGEVAPFFSEWLRGGGISLRKPND